MKKTLIPLLALIATMATYGQRRPVERAAGIILDTLTTVQLNNLPSAVKVKGAYFHNRDTGALVTWDGSAWVSASGPGGGANQLVDLADVSSASPASGNGLMGNGTAFVARPLVEADISDLSPHTVDTDDQDLSEVLSQGNDAGNTTITNLADPVNPQDAATRAFVLANAGSVTLDAAPTDGSTNGAESNGIFDALSAKVNIDPNSPIQVISIGLAETYAEIVSAGLGANTVAFSKDGGSTLSLNSLTDVTTGSPGTNSSGTLRILADPNTDGNYEEYDWTPPGGVSGNFVYEDDDSPITDFRLSAGSTAALASQPAPSGYYRINIDTTGVTGTPVTDYFIDDLTLGLAGSDLTITAGRNGTSDVVSNTITLPSGGASSLNDLSDVTIGTPGSGSDATLRVLADQNTDGTLELYDWTPPTGGGGLASTDIDTSPEIAAIVTDETGTGNLVLSDSPSLVTPDLGTPSALVLTNATGLTSSGIVDGSVDETDLDVSTNASLDLADSATQPGDGLSTLSNDLNFIRQDSDSPISGYRVSVGSTAALTAQPAPSGYYRVNIDTTGVSGTPTTDYYIDGLTLGLAGSDLTVTASRNGTTDVVSNTISLPSGGGATNLSYTPSATDGTVTSDTGTDATIPAGSTVNASLMLPGDKTKLNGIESGADVTDATNVNAAGATMNTDTDISGNSWVLDEDDMSSNDATKVPSQQSVKAYVDANAGSSSQTTGSFTPSLSGTYSSFSGTGYYIKVGNMVTVWIEFTNVTSATSQSISITGLPVAIIARVDANFTFQQSSANVRVTGNADSDFSDALAVFPQNTTNINITSKNPTGDVAGTFGTGTIQLTATYISN